MSEVKEEKNGSNVEGGIFENLEDMRLGQDFSEAIGVKKQITTVPVRKPPRQDFVRVHYDESYHLETAVLEIKEDRENYLVVRSLWEVLPNEVIPKKLYTTINRQGVLFLWPVRLPDSTGRLDGWNNSAHKAADMAKNGWIRIASNRSLGAYEIFKPEGNLPDPEWPELEFKEILKIAFQDRIIENLNHPVLKQLRGQI